MENVIICDTKTYSRQWELLNSENCYYVESIKYDLLVMRVMICVNSYVSVCIVVICVSVHCNDMCVYCSDMCMCIVVICVCVHCWVMCTFVHCFHICVFAPL